MTTQRLTYLGLESFWWTVLTAVIFLLAITLIIRIYQYERKLVSRLTGWGLLSLRITVLLLILLVTLQPTLIWTSSSKEQTKILVALDVSESMDLIDRQATETERKQWAVALGMIRPEALSKSTKSPKSTEEPTEDYTQPEPWKDLTRFELSRQLISAPKIGLLDRLKKISTSNLMIFSSKTQNLNAHSLVGTRAEIAGKLVTQVTSFSQVLQEAATRGNETAVVLITDGVQTADENPLEAANALSGLNRPVFSVLAGSISQPVDLAIESIDYPETVYKKDQPLIRVRVATFGYEGQPISVSLTDVTTGNRIAKEIVGAERYADVEFDLPLETPGRQRFIVEVQPVAGAEGATGPVENLQKELRLENNQQEFGISVIDDTSHVLLVDGEGRWEFRFLEAAYHRDDRVDLNAVLFKQPYLGLLPHVFLILHCPDPPVQEMPSKIWIW